MELTYYTSGGSGDAGDQYTGLDRFGRVVDQRWDLSGTDLERLKYGYDQASNQVWRQNTVAGTGQDQYYTDDGLYQIKTLQRGTLNTGKTGISGTPSWEEDWNYDPLGNWNGSTSAYQTKVAGTTTLDQNRTHSKVNEITNITESTGTAWTTPVYDAAGNMTSGPQPLSPGSGYDLTYDAWNRLVEVAVTGGSVVASYAYDGASRRVTKTGSDTRHYYYDDQWRVVEERLNTATTADRRFVWGIRRLDDLILRDRVSNIRLYALDDKINVTAVVDTSGTVQERYGYNGFGGVRYMDASFATITASAFDWETLFDSYRYDTDTGFYQVRYRYLHPLLGRWITRDPLGDLGFEEMRRNQQPILGDRSNRWSNINRIGRGADSSTINIPPEFVDSIHHPYGFVDNNPQGSIDSLGLDRWMVFGPWIHWHLRVDYWDRCCNKIGQKDIEFLPKSGWREFYALSLAGQISGVDGKVNIMTDGGDGWAYAHRHTTCIQDKGLLAAAEFVQADPPRYYLELFNCHDFALELFNLP